MNLIQLFKSIKRHIFYAFGKVSFIHSPAICKGKAADML